MLHDKNVIANAIIFLCVSKCRGKENHRKCFGEFMFLKHAFYRKTSGNILERSIEAVENDYFT